MTWTIGVLEGGDFGRAKGPKMEPSVNWKKLLKSSEAENRNPVWRWTDEGKEGEFTRKLKARDYLELMSDTGTICLISFLIHAQLDNHEATQNM